MNLDNIEIKITRQNGNLVSAMVVMPTWHKKDSNGHIIVSVPLLGELQTWGVDEEDVETAVSELFQGFCIMAEKHGKGLEAELELLGWVKSKSKETDETLLGIRKTKAEFMNGIMKTGNPRVLSYNNFRNKSTTSPSSFVKPLAYAN